MQVKANLIGGQWIAGQATQENINPSDTSDVIGVFAQAAAEDVSSAVAAAKEAQAEWAVLDAQSRHDILDRTGNTILARKEELGALLAREEGKILPEAIGETIRAGNVFKFFAGECLRNTGDLVSSVRPGIDIEVTREPVGIVGIITPWNFPIAIPAWKIAPALAYGNTVVCKPADLTPACAHAIAEILMECGLPGGVFNLVMGRGSIVGEAILDHPDITAISFTGSVNTGQHVAEKCLQTMKKVQLEMGGKNPTVVLDDADLEVAVSSCLNSAFFSTGQRCTASSRFIVQEGIHDEFVRRMTEEMSALKIGPALDPNSQMGPVVDERQLVSNLKYVALAKEEGATVIGGERFDGPTTGFYQKPALFTDTHNKMRINQEEIFGPCASVIKVKDFEEAVAVANETEFGLSAGICTQSLKYAAAFKKRAQAGLVMVNLPTAGIDYHVPFGGRKGSSYGPREQGSYAKEFYTIVKTSYVSTG
ncbi:aldehyde dehydrogenase family protein [Sneathiella sp.]|jgi:acyl-CoA reductase-like NAD-dependent aldehyde dehydrogenase|uniref:aldehyde dehydrogenase family protein n=1 Tax=Sneathiella sp. TaxID=1964365 RepID=UPI0039E51268